MTFTYGQESITVNLPVSDNVEIVEPGHLALIEDTEAAIRGAIENPIGTAPLAELVNGLTSACVVVDDITRPTPTRLILEAVSAVLLAGGIERKNTSILFALGTHRKMTFDEEVRLLGTSIRNSFSVYQHDAFTGLKTIADRNSPDAAFQVNRHVAEADIRICTGLIKPHGFAGYTGGAKAILPGSAGMPDIKYNHSLFHRGDPQTQIGNVEGNPVRQDLEKKVRLLEPTFLVNVLLSEGNRLTSVVAGDLIEAHREGVRRLDRVTRVVIGEQADAAVAVCPPPVDIDLGQAAFGAMVAAPSVKKGGVIILYSHCPEGLGSGYYRDMLLNHSTNDIKIRISDPANFECGQWNLQSWVGILQNHHLIIAGSTGIPKEFFERSEAIYACNLDEAWLIAKRLLKKERIKAYFIPKAPYTIIHFDERK